MERGALQFDGWTVDRVSGEISRDGHRTRLPPQPLRILIELTDRAGDIVTREQLVKALWPQGVVDFDNGLNVAVRKLRIGLDDVGDTPRYVETLPRVGYRFIGQLDAAPPPAAIELQRALTDGSFLVNWMRLDPRMDPLRGRKCFTHVEKKLYGESKNQ